MTRRTRLDAELVRRGLARSREQAAELVVAGQVRVPGRPSLKPASQVTPADPIVVDEPRGETYVSRGGHKLAGALDAFAAGGLEVDGRRALDAGASTGGFTDVLLRRGVRAVVCVDVGYGQLAWPLRTDERVTVLDRTNVRGSDTRGRRRTGRPGRRRSLVHLPAPRPAGARVGRCRGGGPGADGQAAVRGRPRRARARRRRA